MASELNYRETFFYQIAERILGYKPWIEIKPSHLANGLFRAICKGYVNNSIQHTAISPKYFANLTKSPEFQNANSNQQRALEFLESKDNEREMLNLLLNADRTAFKRVNTSSYTLSHANHVTNDNHDRDVGRWLYQILMTGDDSPAIELLKELLQQDVQSRSDELSVLTLPLDDPKTKVKSRAYDDDWSPASLDKDQTGQFRDPLIRTIRYAFDQLAQNETESAKPSNKLDILRRFAALGCFAVYLHLANTGIDDHQDHIPMLFCFEQSSPTLRQASIRSYQWMLRSIDEFLRCEIQKVVSEHAETQKFGSWASDEDIEGHIEETIDWFRLKSMEGREKEESKVADFRRDCWRFYRSYRGEAARYSPPEAFANAATDMLGLVLSSKPQAIARALGTRIGLLNPGRDKRYSPQPDFLEILVRATIPKGETWTLVQLATHWADEYGILIGALGDDNNRLARRGISAVDGGELMNNVAKFALLLEVIGYARRYADGVVLIRIDK